MKTVLIHNEVLAPGGTGEETIIEPDTDLLSKEDGDLESFAKGEVVHVKIHDSDYETNAVVTQIHIDSFGVLVQLLVDWDNVEVPAVA